MQHITNKMYGLLSEAIEPKANRRLLPPAPSPREGVWGWGNVGRRSPFARKRKSRLMAGFLCGVVNKYLTNFNDLYDVYLYGMQIDILSMKL